MVDWLKCFLIFATNDWLNDKKMGYSLAVDEPLEYARLYLEGNLQMWVNAEDSLSENAIWHIE